MRKIKVILQIAVSVAVILLLNHLNGSAFVLPEFADQVLDTALVFVNVLAVFALIKFINIVFALFGNREEHAEEEN